MIGWYLKFWASEFVNNPRHSNTQNNDTEGDRSDMCSDIIVIDKEDTMYFCASQ